MLLAGFALVWLTLLAAYGIRVAVAGRFAHARAEKEPGSPFLGRFLIEFGYWAFSPLEKVCNALGAADVLNLDGGPEATLALHGEPLEDTIGTNGRGLPLVLVVLPP